MILIIVKSKTLRWKLSCARHLFVSLPPCLDSSKPWFSTFLSPPSTMSICLHPITEKTSNCPKDFPSHATVSTDLSLPCPRDMKSLELAKGNFSSLHADCKSWAKAGLPPSIIHRILSPPPPGKYAAFNFSYSYFKASAVSEWVSVALKCV